MIPFNVMIMLMTVGVTDTNSFDSLKYTRVLNIYIYLLQGGGLSLMCHDLCRLYQTI